MTAYRIITDHEELDNAGQLPHATLDDYILNTPWLLLSSNIGPQPPSSRRLSAGSGVTFIDNGPGQDLVINASTSAAINWLDIPVGQVDGINVFFTLTNTPLPSSSVMFFVNGILQKQGPDSDYVISGNTVHLLYNYRSGSNLQATYPY